METLVGLILPAVQPDLPTRWGTQLNGNKQTQCCSSFGLLLPTRWGTQLNGNAGTLTRNGERERLPTRWGTQLNGNWKRQGRKESKGNSPLAGEPN